MNQPLDLKQHLARQLGYLQNSCNLFDQGQHDEAIRIATIVRVLLHDGNTPSLVAKLGAHCISLLSTYPELKPNFITVSPMAVTTMTEAGELVVKPHLEHGPKELIPLGDWWDKPIYRVPKYELSRHEIVKWAANKDGGAHVDTDLPAAYEHVSTTGWTTEQDGVSQAFFNHHFVYLRQFGYELLNSPDLVSMSV